VLHSIPGFWQDEASCKSALRGVFSDPASQSHDEKSFPSSHSQFDVFIAETYPSLFCSMRFLA
jgi:hypothetical protein